MGQTDGGDPADLFRINRTVGIPEFVGSTDAGERVGRDPAGFIRPLMTLTAFLPAAMPISAATASIVIENGLSNGGCMNVRP